MPPPLKPVIPNIGMMAWGIYNLVIKYSPIGNIAVRWDASPTLLQSPRVKLRGELLEISTLCE